MNRWFTFAIFTVLATANVFADDDVATKMHEQEQRIKGLERKLELQNEGNAATPSINATAKIGSGGFAIQSTDDRNAIRFRGVVQLDGRWFSDRTSTTNSDTWLLRRVRPTLEGTVNGIYDFRFVPDFGNGKSIIFDAYVAGRFAPWLVLQVGKFKGPVGLERLQPDQYTRFMELAFPSSLVPNRDIGLQWSGSIFKSTVTYAIGYFNGAPDGSSTDSNSPIGDVDNDGKKDFEARIFVQPFLNSDNFYLRGFGFGVGGSTGKSIGNAVTTLLPSYRTPGQQSMFSYRTNTATGAAPNNAVYADGDHSRLAPQAYYYAGSIGVLGEYVRSSQDVSRQLNTSTKTSATLHHAAWQISATYFLTGEEESYSSFTPNNNFAIGRPGWGAWEIALRYHRLDLDKNTFANGANSFADPAAQPSAAHAVGIGLTWYLNQNVKWQLNFERTRFTGGAASGADKPQENAILTRFALTF